jgi:DNA-binding GntR family transcriptional regulator
MSRIQKEVLEVEREPYLSANAEGTMEKIVSFMRRGLRSGRFIPGQRLLEPDLTRQLGCSRGSLRAALIHLAGEGVVTLNRFRGAHITVLDRKAIEDLLDVLENLVSFIAVRACRNIENPDRRVAIERAMAGLRALRTNGDNANYLEKRQAFYDALIFASDNSEVGRIIPMLRADLLRVQLQTMHSHWDRRPHVDGYLAIGKAVLSGNVKSVERAVQRHVDNTRDALKVSDADLKF